MLRYEAGANYYVYIYILSIPRHECEIPGNKAVWHNPLEHFNLTNERGLANIGTPL